jgi:predicted XRE-type DNA-binding protein
MTVEGDQLIKELRRELARAIVRAMPPRAEYTIAETFDIPQPRMSELNRGLVYRCTMEWLIRRIHKMGGTVSLTITLGDAENEFWRRQRLRREWRAQQEVNDGDGRPS